MASKMAKRFGFARQNTSTDVRQSSTPSEDGSDVPRYDQEKDASTAETTGISEVEANRKLSVFQKTHRWDPNLGIDTFDELEDATDTHDGKHEAQLTGQLVENSPYVEV